MVSKNPRWACASILVGQRSDLSLAEMSHRIGFRLEAVARSAHAALRYDITISQNRGNASAREPRTYHGRGFSLLDARFSRGLSRAVWSFSSMARRRSHKRAQDITATEGASASDIGRAAAEVEGASYRHLPKRCGQSPVRTLPAVKSQRRRQTLLSMARLEAAWRSNAKLGAHAQRRFSAVDQNSKLGTMPPFGTTSGAHPDKPKERPDAQSHAHPCDRTAVRRIGGPHRRRANLARGQ